MRNKFLITFILSFFVLTQTAFAAIVDYPDQVYQGDAFEVYIPQNDIVSVSGTFDGRAILFYAIEREPLTDEPISRGEFLQEMFANTTLGDVMDPTIDLTTPRFPDVLSDDIYFDAIQKAAALDIVHGYEDGNFYPYESVTRAQIAKILLNAYNPELTLPEPLRFEDVPEDHWAYDFIGRATQAEIYEGYPDGLMRPERPINFLEAKLVISRAAKLNRFLEPGIRTYFRGFGGAHRLAETGMKSLDLTITHSDDSVETLSLPLEIMYREFPTEYITLTPQKTELLGSTQQDNTWAMINQAKATTSDTQLWEDPFIIPTDGVTTLGFGDKVYINGSLSGSHFGVDYANTEGTPIYASNNGIITLADWTQSYGNTVIIDHGHNVFTMYLHMNELATTKGIEVKKGDLIGYMGSTGVSTGSHLHFTFFIGTVIVDNALWY